MLTRTPSVYSRAEYLSDAIIHVAGVTLALIGVPVLIFVAVTKGPGADLTLAVIVYGLTLLAMLTCSALYNMIRTPAWTDRLRRIDQSAICLKIVGSYTPFVALAGAGGGAFLATLWSVALGAVSVILFAPARFRFLTIGLFLALGWAGLVGGAEFIAALSTPGFVLILVAGLLYTAGVLFLVWETLPFHNTIWHVFVLTASAVLYAAVLVELAGISAAMT